MQDYDERLAAPLWWWPAGLGAAAVLAYVVPRGEAVHGVDVALWQGGIFVLLAAPIVTFLLMAARTMVRVVDGHLDAGGRRIPVSAFDRVEVLDPAATRRQLGRDGDPRAVVVQRFWVHPSVVATVRAGAAAEPYGLVSTRHPDRLAAAIESARAAATV